MAMLASVSYTSGAALNLTLMVSRHTLAMLASVSYTSGAALN